jgi:ElaB/YqjD/DUF883 family membrane-anchored ribosome-binding protein
MQVNIEDMLQSAGECAKAGCKNIGGRYAFQLSELAKHLREVRDRFLAGDYNGMQEFFDMYVFDDPPPKAAESYVCRHCGKTVTRTKAAES